MDMYLVLFSIYAGPYLCFFGIVLPALVTAITFWLVAVWADLSNKQLSNGQIKIILVTVFVLAAIGSWGLLISYFRYFPIMLD